MNWSELTTETVIRLYVEERVRRSSPQALQPEPDYIPSTAPPSMRWEELLYLMRGVPEIGLRAFELMHAGHHDFDPNDKRQHSKEIIPPTKFSSYEAWEKADPRTRGKVSELDAYVTRALEAPEIARALGMTLIALGELLVEARLRVTENLGRVKAWERQQRSEELKSLARAVLRR